jgi:hypothetical protein
MADLKTLAKRFQFTLQSMLHTRIGYPSPSETASPQRESRPTGTAL